MTERAHSALGASASDRWINCPGSIRMQHGMPDQESVYAREGTAAHHLAERCLSSGEDAEAYIGWAIDTHKDVKTVFIEDEPGDDEWIFGVDDEMAGAVQEYLDFARALIEPGDEWEIEQRFHLTEFDDDFFGTSDLVVYKPAKARLHVADYKHGKGVAVEAKGNPQIRYYGLGAATRHHNRPLDEIHLHIVQPRCSHPDGPIRTEIIDAVSLLEWSADLVVAAERTKAPDAPLAAGDWCNFCRAAAVCPTLKAKALEVARADFTEVGDELVLVKPESFGKDALGKILREAHLLETWAKAVRVYAHNQALAGVIPEGFKLVGTRPTRYFRDRDATQAFLLCEGVEPEDMFDDPKFKSPAKVEAMLKKYGFKGKSAKTLIAHLIDSKSKNTVLAPLEDARPLARQEAASEFDEVAEE